MNRILGIDPGTATTGYGVVDEDESGELEYVKCGVISTPAEMSPEKRLDAIYSSVNQLIDEFSPDTTVIEEIFFNLNVKTAISVGQARGAIIVSLQRTKIPGEDSLEIEEMNPTTVKKTLTGNSKADKKAIQMIVKEELGLSAKPKPNDAADALALAMSFCIHTRFDDSIEA